MASGLTTPAGDELERLRQQYDRLCDLMTRTAESDPAAAERVLTELQALSARILELEAAGAGAAAPAAAEVPPAPAAAGPSDPPPAPAAAAPSPAPAPAEPRPASAPARIVAFRVTPSVGQRPVEAEAAAPTSGWRLDAPPAELGPPDGPQDSPSAVPPQTAPAAPKASPAPQQQQRPQLQRHRADPGATPPRHSITVRRPASKPAPATAPSPAHASPARPQAAAGRSATPPVAARPSPSTTAAKPVAQPVPPQQPVPPAGNATLFSSAIRQWLEQRRAEPAEESPQPSSPGTATEEPAGAGKDDRNPAPSLAQTQPAEAAPARDAPALSRVAAAIEQQAAQIEHILRLCQAHQAALERLEGRIAARLDAAPPAAPDPELPELRAAVEEQRQRITALAKTIHNLAQWLATQRGS